MTGPAAEDGVEALLARLSGELGLQVSELQKPVVAPGDEALAKVQAADDAWNSRDPERVAYATLGWFLVAGNVWLSGGLLFSEEVRAWYRVSGSFGLTNDYIRLARDVMGVGLGMVAFLMLLVSLLPLPAAWLLSRPYRYVRSD